MNTHFDDYDDDHSGLTLVDIIQCRDARTQKLDRQTQNPSFHQVAQPTIPSFVDNMTIFLGRSFRFVSLGYAIQSFKVTNKLHTQQ